MVFHRQTQDLFCLAEKDEDLLVVDLSRRLCGTLLLVFILRATKYFFVTAVICLVRHKYMPGTSATIPF